MKNMIDYKKFDDKKLFNTKELHYNIEKIWVSSPGIKNFLNFECAGLFLAGSLRCIPRRSLY